MKVDFSANLNVYRKNAQTESTTKASRNNGTREAKTDVAEFSRGSVTLDKGTVPLRASILREANYPADPARLTELQQRVKDGTYSVSTDAIVDAILKG